MKKIRRKKYKVRQHKRKCKSGNVSLVRQHYRTSRKGIPLSSKRRTQLKTSLNPKDVERTCYKCKRPLNWQEFVAANQDNPIGFLKKIWNHADTEFYCCYCFDRFHNIHAHNQGLGIDLEINELVEDIENIPTSPYRSYTDFLNPVDMLGYPNDDLKRQHIERNEPETKIIDSILNYYGLDKDNKIYRGIVKAYADSQLEVMGFKYTTGIRKLIGEQGYEREGWFNEKGESYEYDWENPLKLNPNHLYRETRWLASEPLTKEQITEIMPKIVPHYNYFESEKHIGAITEMLPEDAKYYVGRYGHPFLVVHSPVYNFGLMDDEHLRILMESFEQVSEAEVVVDNHGNIEFWW